MKNGLTRLFISTALFLSMQFSPHEVSAQYSLQEAFPNLFFISPVDLQNPGDGTDRLFVVEQRGVISVFTNDPDTPSKSTFLDIQDRVDDAGFEEGLLGLAFHPDYENNGYFYVNYTAAGPNRSVISRFEVTGNPNVADPNSETNFVDFLDPYDNHNGGQVVFGPNDGYLYISTGDGGSFGDPQCRAQNLTEWLGKILRIDVDNPSGGENYGIPADNPFEGNTEGYLEEIYAYGLRNPWRISFDPVTGWLWCGDVGQNTWEEIDIIENGGNYGWAIMEGNHCYNSPWACAPACDATGLIPPIWEYSHSQGISITGGYVYHGSAVPELDGKYIYTDYGSGTVWSLEYDGINPPINTVLLSSSVSFSSFGVDEESELYICGLDGNIYSFVPTADPICEDITLFQAKCTQGGTGPRAQFRIILSNNTKWSGRPVQFTVDGNPVDLVIEDNGTHSRAQGQYPGLGAGTHIVALTDPAGCFEDLAVVCPSDGAASSEWETFDSGWNDLDSPGESESGKTALIGNNPNPFNPSTQITYHLAQNGHITLSVHDILGQTVQTLVEGYQTAGTHSVVWEGRASDGSPASSGLYFYRLRAGDIVQIQKMLLTK